MFVWVCLGFGFGLMEAVISGGTGFLGTNVVIALLKTGDYKKITLFALPGSVTEYTPGSDLIEVVEGDVTNAEDVGRAFAGVSPDAELVVFHICGDTSFYKPLYERQRRINVGGTQNMVAAAAGAGASVFVHTSSVDVALDPMPADYNYGYTKREGEGVVLEAHSDSGMRVVVLRPGMMCGPYDFTLQFGRLFLDLRDGNVPAVPPGGTSITSVESVADAHVAAAAVVSGRSDVAGKVFDLGGVNMLYSDVFAAIAELVEADPPSCILPAWALVAYGFVVETWARMVGGGHPDLNPGQARYMSFVQEVDSSAAEEVLGYVVPDLDVVLVGARDWYVEHQFL